MSSSDPLADLEVPVWVGGREKWVNGLTRRTTCDDVIYALMSHDKRGYNAMELQSYVMYEGWREVERPLKGRTKMLKVWRAWGSECRNVKFFIKKVDNPYESGSEVMKPRRARRHGNSGYQNQSSNHRDKESRKRERDYRYVNRQPERSRRRTTQEREERRRQRHSSRSMEHIWDDFDQCEAIPSCAKYPSADDSNQSHAAPVESLQDNTKNKFFHELVQLIINQEKNLQDQVGRLNDTDLEIESYENKVHMVRVETNGRNYVQDAYLHERGEESVGTSADERTTPGMTIKDESDADTYMGMCEQILMIQDRIADEESKIDNLTMNIFSEIQSDNADNFSLASGYDGSPGKPRSRQRLDTIQECDDPESALVTAELSKLRHEIERSISLSIAQQKQLQLVEDTLRQCETQIQRKSLYVNQLALEVRELEYGDNETTPLPRIPQTLSRLRSKSCDALSSRPPLMPPLEEEDQSQINEFVYKRKESRSHYNSDSGVESVDNKTETDSSDKTDLSLSPKSDHGFVDDLTYATTGSGRKMVPYFTYSTYDPSDKSRMFERKQPYTKANTSDDSNSDTGLSSLHSDEASPVLETLV